MKKIYCAVLALCISVVFFSAGCHGCSVDMDSNDRSNCGYYALRSDEKYYYYNLSDTVSSEKYIRVDKVTGEISFFVNDSGVDGYIPGELYEQPERESWMRQVGDVAYEYFVPEPPVILNSMDNGWRGYTFVSEENYGILEKLSQRYETDGVEFIHTYILDGGDGTAYGFVNVYDHSTGMLFGAGVPGVSGISYGVFIEYVISTGEIMELLRVDGGCITAFDRDTVMFFKDEKYYSQSVGKEPEFLLDDLAYDRGGTSYSSSYTYFNEEHFVLYMHSDDGRTQNDYAYLFGGDGNLISSCQSQDL